ncbi:hypothetical protein HDU96_003105 [Phlyctochytrium bullatum]|nr:hypothetical protein HDU96_003105 [Phlyctochytrium bullatum]
MLVVHGVSDGNFLLVSSRIVQVDDGGRKGPEDLMPVNTIAAAILVGALVSVARVSARARLEPPDGKVLMSAWVDFADTEIGRDSYSQLNRRMGRKFAVLHLGLTIPWADSTFYTGNDLSLVEETASDAAVLLTVNPVEELQTITDQDISLIAQRVANITARGRNVFLRYGADMQASWSFTHRAPALYVDQFRKVASAVRLLDPENRVAMVWAPYGFTNYTDASGLLPFYPGDDHVDWVGLSTLWNSGPPDYSFWNDTLFNPVLRARFPLLKLINLHELVGGAPLPNGTFIPLDYRTTLDPPTRTTFLMALATIDDGSLVWAGQPWRLSTLPPTSAFPWSQSASTSPTETLSPPRSATGPCGPSTAVIAGIVVAGVGALLAVVVIGVLWIKRRRRRRREDVGSVRENAESKWEADAKNEPAEPGTAALHVTPIMMRTVPPSGETKPSSLALFSSTIPATPRAVEAKSADGALFAEAATPFEEAEESEAAREKAREAKVGLVREWAASSAEATMGFGGGMEAWTAEEVSERLRTMGVSAAAVEALRASNVDGQALLVLTPADLPRLGIEPASHAVVMVAVRFLRVLRESGEGVDGTADSRGADVVAAVVDEGDGIAMPPPGYSEA